jgi:hypothetical protein
MTKQAIIERTLKAINQLPEDKAEEISDFADFVIHQYESHKLSEAIQNFTSSNQSFKFLETEEDIYTLEDLKEVYNG